jgi:hypothetical protein
MIRLGFTTQEQLKILHQKSGIADHRIWLGDEDLGGLSYCTNLLLDVVLL